jgi:DnaJ-class molecular chaperone
MDEDFYTILELPRTASQADIQAAYRRLARKYHPDMNPEDDKAKQKFQKVQRAFETLNDAKKRENYDRYGSAFEQAGGEGAPHGQYSWNPQSGGGDFDFSQFFGGNFGGGGKGPEEAGGGGFAEILRKFGAGAGGGASAGRSAGAKAPRRGEDLHHELQVPFATAIKGGEVDLGVVRKSGEETIRVKIPAGVSEGQKIRLRGQGGPAPRRGEPGDLIITVHVAAHPFFTRRGNHLDVNVPVTLAEAALGAKVDIPTPDGTVTITIPPGTSSGKRLRLKGRGVSPAGRSDAAGDLYAEIQIVLPEKFDAEAIELIKRLAKYGPADPRDELRW